MIRSALLAAAVALALPLVACASTPQAPQIDSAYRITGAPQAAPIQAFSLNGSEYLQLRNVQAVPAPLTPDGAPLRYRIYGHYLVVPAQPEIILHYGAYTATVAATGFTSAPVTSVRMAENAMRAQVIRPAPVAAATTLPNRYLPPPVTAPGVHGAIHAGNPPAGPQPTTVAMADAADWLHQHPAFGRKGTVQITADGGVVGAQTASALMQACVASHRACQVRYHGAPRGKITLEIHQ